jgi:AAA domain/Bifunctional DNA primase/polymerase, N-terminal
MSFKNIALSLIERGIKVIPVQPGEKRCLLPNWPQAATTNPAQIEVWNSENSHYNVGAVGTPDTIAIFDCDVVGLRESIENETGMKFPATLIIKSAGKGAEHIYFTQTARSRALGNRSSMGLYDLQSNNKYVVGAGSKLNNGREYTVVDGSPIAGFPDWLCDWVERNSVKERHASDDEIGAPVHKDFDFDAFCEHYELVFFGEKAGKWVFKECPFKGDHHHTTDGKPDFAATVMFFDGGRIGFSCLATGCEGHGKSIGDLIRFLNNQHGTYDGPIFEEEDWDEVASVFGLQFEEVDPVESTPFVPPAKRSGPAHPCVRCGKGIDDSRSTSICDACVEKAQPLPPREPVAAATEQEPTAEDSSHTLAEGKLQDTIYSMITIRADQVKIEKLEWLWPDRIPLGKITYLSGKPDCGKSVTLIDIIARVSSGRDFPDAKNPWGERKVLLGVSEDGLGDTVKPRLIAAGAKLENIELMQLVRVSKGDSKKKRNFALKADMKLLRHTLKKNPDIMLVALDPITGYYGDVDSNKDKDIRPVMDELSKVCDETRVTFVAVMHQNKRTDVSAVQKVLGASSVAGSARTVWGFSRDAEEKELCHMSLVKNNLSAKRSGLDYRLISKEVEVEGPMIPHPIIEWAGENEATADELAAKERDIAKDGSRGKMAGMADAFLVSKFAEAPKWQCLVLYADAEKEGISVDALKRRKTTHGLSSRKVGDHWWWMKPEANLTPEERTMVANEAL